jgi:sec-independent protein translocase protein TatC
MLFSNSKPINYDEDFFADSRMSFGDHIEELRTHLVRAMIGFALCLVLGFILDGIGSIPPATIGLDRLGITEKLPVGLGLPVLGIIKYPVERAVQNFYDRRAWSIEDKLDPALTDEEKAKRYEKRERLVILRRRAQEGDTDAIRELNEMRGIKARINIAELRKVLEDESSDWAEIPMEIPPVDVARQINEAQQVLGKRMYLTTLSAQEALIVYFKVSIVCGIIVSSPWIFWQLWTFVAAGLYPHERHYVYQLLGPSIGLFLFGSIFCIWAVLPAVVVGLLSFNEWIGLDPDLRLSEWLGFALLLPLVFGVSFQTPLVMLFLARINMFTAEQYRQYWRHAMLFLAFFAAMITPPDIISMLFLWLPMYLLYEVGILLVKWFPNEETDPENWPGPETPVGV